MSKIMLICAPATSRSGYGDHARDLIRSLLDISQKDDKNKFEIKIADVRWGDCPRNALDKNKPEDKKILDCFLASNNQLDRQPDIYVDIRIPNEFQTAGKFNIGITAGIESNVVSQEWIEHCNKMDLVIVPSEHSKVGIVQTVYDKMQDLPDGQQQKIGELKLEKPIEVLFEGVRENIYKPLNKNELTEFSDKLDSKLETDFNFLCVGLWGKGGIGEDRKNIGKMIKIFCETFSNRDIQPGLILKTNTASFSILDKEEVSNRINHITSMFPKNWKLPKIYLLHGSLTDKEMNELYNHPKVKAMISFTHGEGFGRPLLEASMVGLPIIASGWSGQLDFLTDDESMLVGGNIVQIPESQVWDNIMIEQSSWFEVDERQASNVIMLMTHEFKNQKKKALKLMERNRKEFTLNKMTDKFMKILEDKYFSQSLPEEVSIKLPKLKKS